MLSVISKKVSGVFLLSCSVEATARSKGRARELCLRGLLLQAVPPPSSRHFFLSGGARSRTRRQSSRPCRRSYFGSCVHIPSQVGSLLGGGLSARLRRLLRSEHPRGPVLLLLEDRRALLAVGRTYLGVAAF